MHWLNIKDIQVFLYIVNDIKEKYKDKDKYKNDLLKTKKEIC